MTAPDNPFFARAIANRLWAHYFGRGLVEPIDDLRATNPPTNEPLLDALAAHLREVKYDLKAFTRTLLNSRVYQLSSRDERLATRTTSRTSRTPAARRCRPKCCSTRSARRPASPEKFNGWPDGYAGDPGLGQPHAVVLLPHLRPAGAGHASASASGATSRASPRRCT